MAETPLATPLATLPASPSSATSDPFRDVCGLDNQELTLRLERLNQRKQAVDAELLLHLSLFEQRGLHRNRAYPSMFAYCVKRLGFSEDEAYKRIAVARMLRQYPLVFALLTEGRIHLSALLLLKPLLNENNHAELLRAACGHSKREVERLVAALAPRPDVPSKVRKLPEARCAEEELPKRVAIQPAAIELAAAQSPTSALSTPCVAQSQVPMQSPTGDLLSLSLSPTFVDDGGCGVHKQELATPPMAPLPHRAIPSRAPFSRIEPLSSASYRVVFTASDVLRRKLERARELSSHAVSPSDLPGLLERALDLLVAHEEKRRFALTGKKGDGDKATRRVDKRAATEPSPSGFEPEPTCRPSRYIPAEVRRAVWERDNGCCAFVDAQGQRCGERCFLQMEHQQPHALGGAPTVDNCELLCAAHNALRAEQVFGRRRIFDRISGRDATDRTDR